MQPSLPNSGISHVNTLLNSLRQDDIRKVNNQSRRQGTTATPRTPNFTFNFPSLPAIQLTTTSPLISPSGVIPALTVTADQGAPRAVPRPRTVRRNFGLVAPASWVEREERLRTGEELARKSENLRNQEERHHNARWRYAALALGWLHSPPLPIPPPAPPSSSGMTDPTLRLGTEGDTAGTSITPIPSLLNLALRSLFTSSHDLVTPDLETLPNHLLALISRYSAVFRPDLFYESPPLSEPLEPGTVEGRDAVTVFDVLVRSGCEFLFVGDGKSSSTTKVRSFLSSRSQSTHQEADVVESWDEIDAPLSPATHSPSFCILTSVHLMRLPLTALESLVPLLPLTVTHLSILSFSPTPDDSTTSPFLLKKLSRRLPLLEFLDLSYNPWITYDLLQRIEWDIAWQRLEVLSLRECDVRRPGSRVAVVCAVTSGKPRHHYRFIKREHVNLRGPHHNEYEELSVRINFQRPRSWIDVVY